MGNKTVLEIQSITKMPIEAKEVWEQTAAIDCILELRSPVSDETLLYTQIRNLTKATGGGYVASSSLFLLQYYKHYFQNFDFCRVQNTCKTGHYIFNKYIVNVPPQSAYL